MATSVEQVVVVLAVDPVVAVGQAAAVVLAAADQEGTGDDKTPD